MSQILRLCTRNISYRTNSLKPADLPHVLASEIFKLQGCHSCRAFRSNPSQGAHQSSSKANAVGSTSVKERACSQPDISVKLDQHHSPIKLIEKDNHRDWAQNKEQLNLSRIADLQKKGIRFDGLCEKGNLNNMKPFIYIDEWGLQLRKFQSRIFEKDSRFDNDSLSTVITVPNEKSVASKTAEGKRTLEKKTLKNNELKQQVKRKHIEGMSTSSRKNDLKASDSQPLSLPNTETNTATFKHVTNSPELNVSNPISTAKEQFLSNSGKPIPSKDEIGKSNVVHKIKTTSAKKMEKKAKDGAMEWRKDLDNREMLADKERKQEHFNHDFKSFVDACLFTDQVDTAYLALKKNRHNKVKKPEYLVTDVTSFSSLLHYYSRIGDISKTTEIMECLKVSEVKPNMDCYAAILCCLGNQEEFSVDKTRQVLNDMETEGLDVRDIFIETDLMKNEKQIVLQVLNHLIEGYTPNLPPSTVPYSNPLLNDLNEPLEPAEMKELNPYHGVLSPEELKEQIDRQIDIESKDLIYVKSVEKRSKLTDYDIKMSKRLQKMKANWRHLLIQDFKKELKSLERREKGKHDICLSPFLKLFKPEEYVDLLMGEIERLCVGSESYSPSTSTLWHGLGSRVFQKYIIKFKEDNRITDQVRKQFTEFINHYCDLEFSYNNHRECYMDVCRKHSHGNINDPEVHSWSYHLQKRIGRKLYDLIMNKLKIDCHILSEDRYTVPKMIPAFYQVFRSYGGRTKAEVKPHPVLLKLFHGNYISDIPFETSELPMLVPPMPWYSANRGGYLISQTKIMRVNEYFHEKSVVDCAPSHQLNGVFDALNILDMCPWKINKPMLEIIIDLFNRKGDKNLDIPPPPSECPATPIMTLDMTVEQKKEIRYKKTQLKQQKSEMYSLWCNELYKLSIANQYKDNVFWFPHNLDFRGRTYPCPPHFNHLGSDVTRSIICFAKGKPLGKDGLDWLKIHLVNLTGFKKRSSNHERLAFANGVMEDILNSADNPFHGNKWWQESDEPWQTLAACKEIAMATRSPNPEKYVCHFPVHQDGSCNGLQHYAALGRDQAGAESVNLCPFDAPQDVYSDVAELVEEVRKTDASNGVKIAEVLEGFVRRKVIKQTVMTTVYGVTPYGARLQILRQLKDIAEFPEKHQWQASAYLTEATFKCLQKMFTSTKMIQDWFIECADKISNSCRKPVEWITPLDLPVLQPYFRKKPVHVKGITNESVERNMFEKPNSMKQKNGFPPNFIHSLDSVHMMLTALHCWRAGITYVSVHDCYWTHACDVDIMNKICRNQFVALHSQPILEDLSKFMLEKFGDLPVDMRERNELKACLSRVPEKGSFDLNSVKKSTYFFS